jgi:hypothetical protein
MPGKRKCAEHLAKRKAWRSTPSGAAKVMLRNMTNRCVKLGLVCTLDEKWILEKFAGRCELTGMPFDLEAGKRGLAGVHFNPYAPSIDRKVRGDYTPENCRMVLVGINFGMNCWGEEAYRNIAKAYLKHRRVRRIDASRCDVVLAPRDSLNRKH